MWRSESISYEVLEPKKKDQKAADGSMAYLACGYGLGLTVDTVDDKDSSNNNNNNNNDNNDRDTW